MVPQRLGQPGFSTSGLALRIPSAAGLESRIETLQRNGSIELQRSGQHGFSVNAPPLSTPPIDDRDFKVPTFHGDGSIQPLSNPRKRSLYDASQQLPTSPFPDPLPNINGWAPFAHQSPFSMATLGAPRTLTPDLDAGGGMDYFQTPTSGVYQFGSPISDDRADWHPRLAPYFSLASPADSGCATSVPASPTPFEAKLPPSQEVPSKEIPGMKARRSAGARTARARAAPANPPQLRRSCDGCFKAKVRCKGDPGMKMCRRCASHGFLCKFSPTARATKNSKSKAPAMANPTAREEMAMNPTAFDVHGMGPSLYWNANFDASGVCTRTGAAGYTPPASEEGGMSRSDSLVGELEVNAMRHYGTMPQGLGDSVGSLESSIFGFPLEPFDAGPLTMPTAPTEPTLWEQVANQPPPVAPGPPWEPEGDSCYSETIAALDNIMGIAHPQYTGGQQQNLAPW